MNYRLPYRILDKETILKMQGILEQTLLPPYDQGFSEIQNLLYNRGLAGPADFWNALGKVFKIYMIMDRNPESPGRKFCSMLRTLSLHLFRKWQSSCSSSALDAVEEEKEP